MSKEPIQSAEEVLNERINAYNLTVHDVSKFAFTKKEQLMFSKLMDDYAESRMPELDILREALRDCVDTLKAINVDGADDERWVIDSIKIAEQALKQK